MDNIKFTGSFSPRPGSLKKQLSFDEKVTEFQVLGRENEEKNSIKWWKPSETNAFGNYCKSTSLHALQYVGGERIHLGERILWGIIFLISMITALWLINQVFDKYYHSPVVVTFEPSEMFIGDLPFPAVTICNMNRVLKSKANEYMRVANMTGRDKKIRKARQDVYYLDHVCSVSNKPFSKMFNYSMKRGAVDPDLLAKVRLKKGEEEVQDVRSFLANASQPCSEMIQLCMWEGSTLNCAESFRSIETNFGKCCVFNMVPHTILNRFTNDSRDTDKLLDRWQTDKFTIDTMFGDNDEKYRRPRHQHRAGKASGLMFLADPAINQYFCTSSDSTGFRLGVHFPTDVPHVTDFGLAIRPNYEHFVSITPEVIRADDVIRSYSIEKRNCYFEDEFQLKYYTYYSASNCLDECVANLTYEKCNCVRYYMPRDDTRDICKPGNITCAEDVKNNLFKTGVKSMCQFCLPTCTEVRYTATSTMAPLQRLDLWVDDTHNKTAPWAKSNISIVHVYFGQDSTYPKVRGQLYGTTDLIANTGGLLGLCMGFSMLSLVEVIYHCTIRPWCKRKESIRHQEESKKAVKSNGHSNNGFIPDDPEPRRVNMKPGDDGRYHLQNKNCSNSSYKPASICLNCDGNIITTKPNHDIVEDSRL